MITDVMFCCWIEMFKKGKKGGVRMRGFMSKLPKIFIFIAMTLVFFALNEIEAHAQESNSFSSIDDFGEVSSDIKSTEPEKQRNSGLRATSEIQVNIVDKNNFHKVVDAKVILYRHEDLATPMGAQTTYKGSVAFSGLAPGKYRVVAGEALTPGFLVDYNDPGNPPYVDIEVTRSLHQVTLRYIEGLGSVRLIYLNEKKQPISGAIFKLIDRSNGSVVRENLKSDASGKVHAFGLRLGEYAFVETESPENYALDTTPVYVELTPILIRPPSDPPYFSPANTVRKFNKELAAITVNLVDKNDITKKIDAKVELYNHKDFYRPLSLQQSVNGTIKFSTLEPGTYRLIATEVLTSGYLLDYNSYYVDVVIDEVSKEVTLNCIEGFGSLVLLVVDDSGNPLPKAIFELRDRGSGQILADDLESDENGRIQVNNIKIGDYSFVQRESPVGYLINRIGIEVVIDKSLLRPPSAPPIITARNSGKISNTKLGSIRVTPVDKDDPSIKVDAKVGLYSHDNLNEILKLQVTTDGSTLFTNLSPGKYRLIKAMPLTKNYLVDYSDPSDPYYVDVTIVGASDEEAVLTYKKGVGAARLTKTDEKGKPLPGAIFKMINKETQELIEENLETDQTGRVYVRNLEEGHYSFIETQSPVGYELDATPVDVEINNFLIKLPSAPPHYSIINSGRKTNKKSEYKITVEFLNEKNVVVPLYTTTIEGQHGDKVNLLKNDLVIDKIKTIENDGYKITGRPANEEITMDKDSIVVQYKIEGLLAIMSLPHTIDFGEIVHDGLEKIVENPNITGKLIVSDKRAEKTGGWTLNCKITKELTNSADKNAKLPGVLKFFKGGREYSMSSSVTEISRNNSGVDGKVDITNSWGNSIGSDGIKLKYGGKGSPKTGSYIGEITWQIVAGTP